MYLSYKLSTPFESFYRSSLIDELGLKVISDYKNNYKYSNFYNKLLLGEMLDRYNLYGEKNAYLEKLYSTFLRFLLNIIFI